VVDDLRDAQFIEQAVARAATFLPIETRR